MARTGENIYKRKDGRWEARCIAFYDAGGKAKYKYLYAKTYADAKAKMRMAQAEAAAMPVTGRKSGSERYDDWLSAWLELKRFSVKESTYIRYRNTIKTHIHPELGKYPIQKISTALLESFAARKLKNGRLDGKGGLSAKTLSDILVIIKDSFRYAKESGTPTICAFDRISFKKSKREMRVLSTEEQRRLLHALLHDMDLCKLGVFLCLYTGLRIGELCALQWRDISFPDKTLRVEHTMQRLQWDASAPPKTRILVTEPKSAAALRTIPLPDFILAALKPFACAPDTYVLSGKCERSVEPRTMQNKFKRYLAESKIEDANFHSLRHTFATRCVEAGFDAKTLSEILGHSGVRITLERYVHSSMQLKRNNMDKLSLT